MGRSKLTLFAAAALAVAVAIQFVQPDRTNPSADAAASFEAVAKPSREVAAMVSRSCGDCHSNRTAWPWYSRVSPVSCLVAKDVKEGRSRLNLSEWHWYGEEMSRLRIRHMCEQAKAGNMPLWQYTIVHSEAKLNASDIGSLCAFARLPNEL